MTDDTTDGASDGSDGRPLVDAHAALSGPSAATPDDHALPFRAEASGVTGRIIRLGPLVDEILNRHDYSSLPAQVLGQGLILTAMLGTALKFGSRLTLQTQTDGVINFLVVDYQAPGRLRGYASFDADRIAELEQESSGAGTSGETHVNGLLGQGRLAITIDPGPGLRQYQGLVAVDKDSLEQAALQYFRQSEQLPTFLRLAIARHYSAETDKWTWRAGGLLLQYLTNEGGKPVAAEQSDPADPEAELRLLGEDDENWERTRILAETVQDHELLDPTLSPEALLYRLFHEEGVRVYPSMPVTAGCSCDRERVGRILSRFDAEEVATMREDDGRVRVNCEFCSREYYFTQTEIAAAAVDD